MRVYLSSRLCSKADLWTFERTRSISRTQIPRVIGQKDKASPEKIRQSGTKDRKALESSKSKQTAIHIFKKCKLKCFQGVVHGIRETIKYNILKTILPK